MREADRQRQPQRQAEKRSRRKTKKTKRGKEKKVYIGSFLAILFWRFAALDWSSSVRPLQRKKRTCGSENERKRENKGSENENEKDKDEVKNDGEEGLWWR